MKISVITVVAGRHDHLASQLRGLASSSLTPWEHVVVSMGDPSIPNVLSDNNSTATYVYIPATTTLPLAQARNAGAAAAIAGGAELLVFLDVDCIPSRGLLARYWAASTLLGNGRSLLCGPVTYLDLAHSTAEGEALADLTNPHAARPNPPSGAVERGENYDLFWSLSFAVASSTWTELAGFCEDYRGYGGEDTDFGASAKAAGVGLRWVGGAHAYHRFHPVSDPPIEHLDDIVANARTFRGRWNRWPMVGWLDAFAERGLLTYDETDIAVTRSPEGVTRAG